MLRAVTTSDNAAEIWAVAFVVAEMISVSEITIEAHRLIILTEIILKVVQIISIE